MTNYITKGDRVEITLAGKKKKGTVTDVVPSLWGGVLLTVQIGKEEITADINSLTKL